MFPRRSLKLPITLGVVMIVLLVGLTVGWVFLAVYTKASAAFYWTFLSVGTSFLALVLIGVVTYLTLSIKAVNLNRRQSNFLDSVTHELKSPIASLKLYLQTMTRRQVSEEERKDFCQYMLDDVKRLDELVNHLLDTARLGKGSVDEEREDVELSSLLRQCAETVCLRHHVPIETVQFNLSECAVFARRGDLELIFRNLIDNAVKYAGAPPQVEVNLESESGDRVAVRISDNGPGIPAKLRRKIFGRFVRVGEELERQKPGTGLGLYLVRIMIKRLRGTIRVHDGPNATGTVFEVHLPGRHSEPEDTPTEQTNQPSSEIRVV